MKQLVSGLLCGVIFMAGSVFVAGSIEATAFPCNVNFHQNGIVKQLPSKETIININNRTYIPLRAFSEAMGATVNFVGASETTYYENLIEVNLSSAMPQSQLSIQDSEGFVNIEKLTYGTDTDGNRILTGGTIRILKELKGKRPFVFTPDQIKGIESESKYLQEQLAEIGLPQNKPYTQDEMFGAASSGIVVQNETKYALKKGDVRPFKVIHDTYYQNPESLVIKMLNPLQPSYRPLANPPTSPLYFQGGFGSGPYKVGQTIKIPYDLGCTKETDLFLQPLNIYFEVYTVDSNNNMIDKVCSIPLETFKGYFGRLIAYEGMLIWDMKDNSGKALPAGHYWYRYTLPAEATYTLPGSDVVHTCNVDANLGYGFNGLVIEQ